MKVSDEKMMIMCMWCGKDFDAYTQGESWCCSEKHFHLYKKYGKIKEALGNIPRYLIWKPYFAISDWFWSEYCPECYDENSFDNQPMRTMLRPIEGTSLHCCENCWSSYEVKRKGHYFAKQLFRKSIRPYFTIKNWMLKNYMTKTEAVEKQQYEI